MITEIQKRTAQAIVNIFETGTAIGDYARVTLLRGDTGHLTYGRAQTTLGSGNLFLLIRDYVQTADAGYAHDLEPYLDRLANVDLSLDTEPAFHALLRAAGHDPVMQDVQDAFFDRAYWGPSARVAERLSMSLPLSLAVVYDSHIHGSWGRMRNRTDDAVGTAPTVGEQPWIAQYVRERRDWLGGHSNRLLRRTIYRMNEFQRLIDGDNWSLVLPIAMRGVRIDDSIFSLGPSVPVSAEDVAVRNLRLTDPPMRGEDVRALEEALINEGYAINVDGVFDGNLDRIVKEVQADKGLQADGIVGPVTRAALGLES